jgi:hypothetical protein
MLIQSSLPKNDRMMDQNRACIEYMMRPAIIFVVALGVTCEAQAQVQPRNAARPADAMAAQVKLYVEPLREWLPLELRFCTEVCDLSEGQVAALRTAADEEFELIANDAAVELERRQRGLKAVDGRVAPQVRMDVGLANELTHSIVCRTLQERWPDAWERFDAERQRLYQRRRQASVLSEVAVLDETLLLMGRQRDDLCERLAAGGTDAWRQPANFIITCFDPGLQSLHILLAGGSLDMLAVPEAELPKLLMPSQVATFKGLLRPWRDQVAVVEDMIVTEEVARHQAASPAAERVAKALLAAKERERRAAQRRAQMAQPAAKAVPVRPQAAAAPNRNKVPGELPPVEKRRSMMRYLERLIDTISAVCELTQAQRDKLLIAGKLDVENMREPAPPAKEDGGQEIEAVHRLARDVGDSALPLSRFSPEASYFHRALRSCLLDDQEQKLALAARERREFQRQAIVAVAVVGFERAAALTSPQCEELSRVFNETLAAHDGESTDNWRIACLREIAQLDENKLRPVLAPIQQPDAKRHQDQITQAAQQLPGKQ